VAVFGVSAAYHRLARSPVDRARMRRLDHSMIFVVIAGTYTPICLVALPPAWGLPLLVTVWLGAIAGIVLKNRPAERFAHGANALYLVLGWAAVAVVPAILRSMPVVAIVLMGVGGLAYTLGAAVLFRRRPDPWPVHFGYHEIWHACTVVAGASHFGMVWMLTAGARTLAWCDQRRQLRRGRASRFIEPESDWCVGQMRMVVCARHRTGTAAPRCGSDLPGSA